jgi:5'-nucleotidase
VSTILVDQDGVIADWGTTGWNVGLDAYGEAAANIPRHADQRTFDLGHERTPDELQIIAEVMNNIDYFALRPIRGARTALRNMLRAGHDVRIVSSPWPSNPKCASAKIDWMVHYFGRDWARRTILTMDKTLVRGDYLIDDKPEVTGAMVPTWKHVHFTQPYNQDIKNPLRINQWNEWESVLA